MTPCSSIAYIWLFTFGNRGWGIFLGLYRQNGLASARSVIWHSLFSRPRPMKSAGNSALKSVGPEFTSPTSFSARIMSPSSTHAVLLSSEHFWLCKTWTGSVMLVWPYFNVAWNWPLTGRRIFPGPRRVWDVSVRLILRSYWTLSLRTVTAAPASSFKRVLWPVTSGLSNNPWRRVLLISPRKNTRLGLACWFCQMIWMNCLWSFFSASDV